MTHVPPAHLQVGASAIFETVSESQAVRLANAIDWRGKSVLMHAASRDFAEMTCVALHRTGVASRCLDGSHGTLCAAAASSMAAAGAAAAAARRLRRRRR